MSEFIFNAEWKREIVLSDGTPLILRYPNEKDIPEITVAVNSIIKEDTYFLLTEAMTLTAETDYMQAEFKRMDKGESIVIHAFDGPKSIGWISLHVISARSPKARELGIAIIKEYRGKGLGTMLLQEAENQARNLLHCSVIKLTTAEENLIGRNLYKKFGFIEVGIIPDADIYNNKVMGEVVMYKSLS